MGWKIFLKIQIALLISCALLQAEMQVIPSHKTINSLCNGSSSLTLQKTKQLKNTRLDLAYLKRTDQIFLWPHLVASAKGHIIGSISLAETKETAEWQQPRFSEEKDILGHIF